MRQACTNIDADATHAPQDCESFQDFDDLEHIPLEELVKSIDSDDFDLSADGVAETLLELTPQDDKKAPDDVPTSPSKRNCEAQDEYPPVHVWRKLQKAGMTKELWEVARKDHSQKAIVKHLYNNPDLLKKALDQLASKSKQLS